MKNRIQEIFKANFSSIGIEVKPEQIKVIESVLHGNNTLCLMPTGAGKSLCYWLAGKALNGITIVIFPLTALLDEQATKLSAHGCKVLSLHSGINAKNQYEELIALYNGEYPDFIFLSPERLSTDGFLEYILQSIKEKINLIVVDEIHCISQWGLSFRPFYKEIPRFIENVFGTTSPPILGLTATLNPKDKDEICRDFNISSNNIIKSKYLLRYNVNLQIVKVKNEDEKDDLFWKTIDSRSTEKILVYLDRISGKRSTEALCRLAISKGYKADYFHSERKMEDKSEIIKKYKSGEITLLFATNAFGMGIDITDIRGVIHYLPPESVEQYYQQVGRAGRDRKSSWAKLFYSDKNLDVRKTHFIEKTFPTIENISKAFEVLTANSTGKKTFNYFDEENAQSAFHYIIRANLVKILCKGIQDISIFESLGNAIPEFEDYQKASKRGLLVTVAKKLNIDEAKIMKNIYQWLVENKIKNSKSPSKCLVVESEMENISDEKVAEILLDVETKKNYKYSVFNDFVNIINDYKNHTQFHQSIGKYLGIGKFELGRMHETLSGVMVRSKSEVIVANILYERNIKFDYEKELYASDGSMYSPDFTIQWNDKTFFWEHLGMLDDEEYSENWKIKRAWYEKYFPGQLLITEESSTLSKETQDIISSKFKLGSMA